MLILSSWQRFAATPTFGKVIPMARGHKRPTRRAMKSPEVWPNVRTRSHEYTVGASANGNFGLIPPFPPRVNRTIISEGQPVGKPFSMHLGNIEYRYTPVLRLPPHGGRRWTGRFERVVRNS